MDGTLIHRRIIPQVIILVLTIYITLRGSVEQSCLSEKQRVGRARPVCDVCD